MQGGSSCDGANTMHKVGLSRWIEGIAEEGGIESESTHWDCWKADWHLAAGGNKFQGRGWGVERSKRQFCLLPLLALWDKVKRFSNWHLLRSHAKAWRTKAKVPRRVAFCEIERIQWALLRLTREEERTLIERPENHRGISGWCLSQLKESDSWETEFR